MECDDASLPKAASDEKGAFRNALFFQLAISIVGLIGFIALKPGMLKGCSDKDIAALEAALETQKAAD